MNSFCKNITYLIITVFLALLSGCAASRWKSDLESIFSKDNAIGNAITIFINTSKWSKQGKVFWVDYYEPNDSIVRVRIVVHDYAIPVTTKDTVGGYDHLFPSMFIEKSNKLFIWKDTTICISKELLSAMDNYNCIDYSLRHMDVIVGGVNNDGAVGNVYYFCKNDLTNYKTTGISSFRNMKRYKTPKLKCN